MSMPNSTISIAGRTIGEGAPCFVIAEIGINHGGDAALCERMIESAAKAGADAVKLQTVTPEESYHPETESYALFRRAVLSRDAMARLKERARALGVVLFSTPGDPTALRLLVDLDVPAVKISSGLLTNLPLIELAAATGKPLILSTGMARLEEVEEAVATAVRAGCREYALLQCTSLYPAGEGALNLRAMEQLARIGACPIGYSDHHGGFMAAVAAVARGASLIEKHFTLDAGLPGADHAISLEPSDFAAMVKAIRSVEAMLGSPEKKPVAEELALRDGRHRRLVAARAIDAGEVIRADDLYLMRLPAGGNAIAARRLHDVVGRRAKRPIPKLAGLTEEMIGGSS
jgi:N,N'-diacetyllegionaminate synthase